MEVSVEFSDSQLMTINRYFTSPRGSIFALKNLPQEVAGALFSRYSRTQESLRELFLAEFAQYVPSPSSDQDEGMLTAARDFYERVLIGYGDDSVAQMGGAHLACEDVSNLAAKALEDGRIGIAAIEKSTRYVPYDSQVGGRWRYYTPRSPRPVKEKYERTLDFLFASYAHQMPKVIEKLKAKHPLPSLTLRHPRTGEGHRFRDEVPGWARYAYALAIRSKACDILRGYLPMATLTNVGLFGTGQAFEHLITKCLSSELYEVEHIGERSFDELSLVIPSMIKRANSSKYLTGTRVAIRDLLRDAVVDVTPRQPWSYGKQVKLIASSLAPEHYVASAIVYPHHSIPLRCHGFTKDEWAKIFQAYASLRTHRREKPGRALEHADVIFDICADIGTYRDLQRHRILTQDRQLFTVEHGYNTPEALVEFGFADLFHECMQRAADLYGDIAKFAPYHAQYTVPFAYNTHWYMKLNLRELVHIVELRSQPQGHPDYRQLVLDMWDQAVAKYPLFGLFGKFICRDEQPLGRLDAEIRNQVKQKQGTL